MSAGIARAELMRQRTTVERERIAPRVNEIVTALNAGQHWYSPQVARTRVSLLAALQDVGVIDACIAEIELDAIDAETGGAS